MSLDDTSSCVPFQHTVSKCQDCLQQIDGVNDNVKSGDGNSKRQSDAMRNANEPPLGPLDPLNAAAQRIRELELELAQAKLAQVEAECKNQDLNHQLSNTLSELQTNRNSWQPWLSKTLNSLQEKVTTRGGIGTLAVVDPRLRSSRTWARRRRQSARPVPQRQSGNLGCNESIDSRATIMTGISTVFYA